MTRPPDDTPAERAYALLLRLYPPSFRARFGGAMRDAFRDQWRAHRRARPGLAALLHLWGAVVADALRHGPAERLAAARDAARETTSLGADYFPPGDSGMRSLWQDLRFAVRTHLAARTATAVAVLVLAVAIGANTAIFSVVEGVLLRSLPFRDPERLVGVAPTLREQRADSKLYGSASRFAFETWRAQKEVFEEVAAYSGGAPVLSGLGDPARVVTVSVTENFFSMLGSAPLLGRAVLPEDAAPGAPPVAVLSYGFWTTRMGSDPGVLGRTVTLDGVAHTVVGVMPRGFRFPGYAVLWRALPTPTVRDAEQLTHRPQGFLWTIARLRPGVTPARAMARLDVVTAALERTEPDWQGLVGVVFPIRDQLLGDARRPLLLVLGAVGFVLLVACANVANIQLARAVARRREIGVRLAMGAGRARLVRQLLTESVLLAVAAGTLGVALAYLGVPFLVRLGGEQLPRAGEIGVNARVLLVTLAASVLTGIVSGLAPALQSVRRASPTALKEASDAVEVGGARHRAGDVLVVAQVALTMVLLAGAGLLAVSFARLLRDDPGFTADRVLVAELGLRGTRHARSETTTRAFAEALLEQARAIPGVAAAAVTTGTPLAEAEGAFGPITVVGGPTPPPGPDNMTVFTSATRDYFRVLGIPLRRGRLLADDAATDRDAVVVNEALARTYFPGVDPIGRQLKFHEGSTGTIVGVVGDAKGDALDKAPPPHLYQAFAVAPSPFFKLALRGTGDPAQLAGAVRAAVRAMDPALPLDRLSTMRELMSEAATRQRFYATLLAAFGASALLMAAAGMYGVVSYAVSRRTRELGVRVALGATTADVLRMVVGRSGRLAATGIVLGALGALWATRALRGMLYGVTPGEPSVLLGVAALLAAVALAASWLPGRRATRVDPAVTLRGS